MPLEFHLRLHRSGAGRRCFAVILTTFVLLSISGALESRPLFAQSSSGSQPIYSLSGSVVNSATGEPIPRALVRTNGMVRRDAFTDAQGHFQIDSMPQCQVTVTAQKPGFFGQQDENGGGERGLKSVPTVAQ